MTIKTLGTTLILALFLTACGGGTAEETDAQVADEEETHEHGPGTHTHEMTADTAGTYSDTTGAFFSEEDSTSGNHEHGPETHTH